MSTQTANEHNKKEHEDKLAREAADKGAIASPSGGSVNNGNGGKPGLNEHDQKEHDAKVAGTTKK